MLLGAIGQLQFEVVQHRLKTEYDCDVRLESCQYTGARWITADTPAEEAAALDELRRACPCAACRGAIEQGREPSFGRRFHQGADGHGQRAVFRPDHFRAFPPRA